jgi:ADP-ribosylglycohydrolase
MMLEIGVGDAYGSCFEGVKDPKWVHRMNDLTYTNNPRKLRKNPKDYQPSLVKPGCYTDDTQMAIAIALAMLDDEEPWTKETLAEFFVGVFHRDQRRGYTTYFLNVLMNSPDGMTMLSKIDGKSTKSGGAMRAGPLGLYPDINEVVAKAKRQASVTHDSWLGMNSAVGAALMTHYFYYNLGPKEGLVPWLQKTYFADMIHSADPFEADGEIVECWHPDDQRPVRVHAWDCLEAALYAIEAHDNMADILQQCVAYVGDVDTVAAIAMGPASLAKDIDQNLPAELVDNLENRRYGRDYLKLLDKKLFEKFPRTVKSHKTRGAVVPTEEVKKPEVILDLADLASRVKEEEIIVDAEAPIEEGAIDLWDEEEVVEDVPNVNIEHLRNTRTEADAYEEPEKASVSESEEAEDEGQHEQLHQD